MQATATKKLPRIRTVRQCTAYLKSQDAESCISEFYIRQLIKNNQIKYFSSGSKKLVDLDYLLGYLCESEG